MGVLEILLKFEWVPRWPRTNMGTEVFCMMLLGLGHMNLYTYLYILSVCIYRKDEIRVYIDRERERE
jgi:hypothetical protein